tara:strand:+ start:53 stop:811 length:759 start_codon:yes stop_codon:yes gene_type:complete
MKKSELRHLIRESLKEIMGEEENNYTQSSTDPNNKYEVVKVKEAGELTKQVVTHEVEIMTDALEDNKVEIFQHLKNTYSPAEIAKFIITLPTIPFIAMAHATDNKSKVQTIKQILSHYVTIGLLGATGLYVKMTNPTIIARKVAGKTKTGLEKIGSLDFDVGKPNAEVYHDYVYDKGEEFLYAALAMLIVRLLLEYRQSIVPKKPGIAKRAFTGIKDMFKEEVEGTDEIMDTLMSMIDQKTEKVVDIIQTKN